MNTSDFSVVTDFVSCYGNWCIQHITDIYAGTWDVLYTDVVKAYDKMKAASVEARLHVGEKMDHVYPVLPTPEGKAARKEIAKILSVW